MAAAERIASERGYLIVRAFNDVDVIEGQVLQMIRRTVSFDFDWKIS